jgi:hypothetical protein
MYFDKTSLFELPPFDTEVPGREMSLANMAMMHIIIFCLQCFHDGENKYKR